VLDHKFEPKSYDLWHDRAVFHFLTASDDRDKYLNQVTTALRVGGFLLIGTFALDGPPKCSGLEVQRYSTEMLIEEFGERFTLVTSRHELHHTPTGNVQSFNYVLMHRNPE
jgi:hypothetical protein